MFISIDDFLIVGLRQVATLCQAVVLLTLCHLWNTTCCWSGHQGWFCHWRCSNHNQTFGFEFPVYIVTSNAGIRSSGYQTHTVWRRPQLDDVVLKNPQNMYCTFTVYLLFTVYIITTTTCNEYGQVNWVCLAICTNNLTWIRIDQNSDDYFLLHTWSMECFPQSTHLITFQVCESCSCSCDLCDLLCIDFLSSFWVFTTWCACKMYMCFRF